MTDNNSEVNISYYRLRQYNLFQQDLSISFLYILKTSLFYITDMDWLTYGTLFSAVGKLK